ncbi:hypothetical protein ACYATL_03070 [Actinotignum timonense]
MRLLSVLEKSATAGQLVALRKQNARPARVAGWPAWVNPQVKAACASHGVPHLWEPPSPRRKSHSRGYPHGGGHRDRFG